MKTKFFNAISLAVIFSLLITSLALADTFTNNVSVGGNDTITVGGSTTITYKINATGGDGETGCNVTDGTPATVTITVPAAVTASTATLTFTNCGVPGQKTVTYSSNTTGDYAITTSISDSGAGTYNNNADFTLHVTGPTIVDTDADGVADSSDNCPSVANPSQTDIDGDGVGDACDPINNLDTDSDGVLNAVDNCPTVANTSQADIDGDGIGDACDPINNLDTDGDGVLNAVDNCPTVANTSQADIDGDGIGDACDPTDDRDLTAPTAAPTQSPSANGAGWNNTNVIVTWNWADNAGGSGINPANCTTTSTSSGEGELTLNATCKDLAGNTGSASYTVNVDKTKPVITGSFTPAANGFGWNNTDVVVSFSCTDALSGVDTNTVAGTTVSAEGAGQSVTNTGTCTDQAGNTADVATVSGISIDKTKPVISGSASPAANGLGWNNTDVTVSFSCAEAGSVQSGLDTNTVAGATLSGEGSGQWVTNTGICTDKAGNTANSATVSGINIDKTAPTLAPTVTPNPVLLNGSAAAAANATDGLSGVASSSCNPVDTSSVGAHSVDCTATDNAGNINSASASYSVAYNWGGFFQPVDNNMLNIAKAGQAIPLKWRLTDANGNPVLNLASVKVTVASLACATGITGDLVEEYAAGASGLQNLGDGYYQFNWKTPTTYASSCKTMKLDLGDGSTHTAQFQFKK